jgi:hypothetical protein
MGRTQREARDGKPKALALPRGGFLDRAEGEPVVMPDLWASSAQPRYCSLGREQSRAPR